MLRKRILSKMLVALFVVMTFATAPLSALAQKTSPVASPKTEVEAVVREAYEKLAGLYDGSGGWAWHVGLPAKSGVGGGIVAVVPGKGAIAVFAPPLDQAGNGSFSLQHRRSRSRKPAKISQRLQPV